MTPLSLIVIVVGFIVGIITGSVIYAIAYYRGAEYEHKRQRWPR